jgi:pimeloyl-ACP methyl ester carboxylesterase
MMPKMQVNGINIYYEQAGAGPDLVLIHGLTGSLASWQVRVVPAMFGHFRVLTYDLRGHGQSDMPPTGYTSADMTCDLVALLDHLGLDQIHLVGHSFGGQVALNLCAKCPDRVICLTISDSRIPALQPIQKLKDWTHWPKWKAQLHQHGITLDEESDMDHSLLESFVTQCGVQMRESKWWGRWLKLLESTTAKADFGDPGEITVETIRQMRMPMQAIYGELSFCLPTLEGLRKHLPSLKSTIVPGIGHWLPNVRPELFVEHVKAFHIALVPTEPGSATAKENSLTESPTDSE